jgi:predicted RND superfamily exporter protein
MAVLPVRVKHAVHSHSLLMERLGNYVVSRRKLLWVATLSFIALTVMGIPRINLDDNFSKYFDHSFEIRKATDFLESHLTGFDIIEYSLKAGESGGVNRPAYLKKVEQFAQWYRAQPGVVHVNTITDVIKRLNENMHGDDKAFYRLPDQRDLAAQYLLLYEMSLPYGLDLNNQINIDKSATRFTVTLRGVSSKQLRETDEHARQWLRKNAPQMFNYGASESMMFANISKRNINQMLTGTALALVLISAIMIFALRSVKLGMLSLIPNLVPPFMAFGVWGLFVGEVGLAIAVVGTMTLGIIVDDTVHFLSKYQRARREHHMDAAQAVQYAFSVVGGAMLTTSVILIAGFGTLAFSGFKVNSDMGLLAAIAIGFALVVDFLLLPLLLLRFDRQKQPHPQLEANPTEVCFDNATVSLSTTGVRK